NKAIENGEIPIDSQLAKERIDSIEYKVIDDIVAKLTERWGDYSEMNHRIRFSSGLPYNRFFAVFVHEIFHALSGQIEAIYTAREKFEVEPDYVNNYSLKVGLGFNKPSNTAPELSPETLDMWWLNEALTDQAMIDLTKEKDPCAYGNERKLLKKLIDMGIPKDKFYAAYYENFNTAKNTEEEKVEHRLPNTRELFKFTNEKFGPGFLLKLDKFIASYEKEKKHSGSEMALKAWEEHGEDFPQFLNNFIAEKKLETK
ncbi:MAG: hypothetical protein AAB895_02630, partial [Patescibacteria group bacterium]